jgi:hypothetical protein
MSEEYQYGTPTPTPSDVKRREIESIENLAKAQYFERAPVRCRDQEKIIDRGTLTKHYIMRTGETPKWVGET